MRQRDHKEWTTSEGVTLHVYVKEFSGTAMAIPLDFDPSKLPPEPPHYSLEFVTPDGRRVLSTGSPVTRTADLTPEQIERAWRSAHG
jgi:hypothetical protein